MDIIWYGLGCFSLTERGYPSLVTDPYDADRVGRARHLLTADIVTSSRLLEEPWKATWPQVRGEPQTLAGPGEYEIGGVFVTGVASSRNRKREGPVDENIVYAVSYDGVVVCHLGELGRTLTQAQAEAIGRVTVLLVPVGVPGGLTHSMAAETVSLVEPDIVVPMQYKLPGLKIDRKPVDGFLKEMGVTQPQELSVLKVAAGGEPEETQIVLLEPQ
ncbi:MAG: MBL fold metallo-hydrolase [Anaerolineae bacterium]|nr:MBL fold metallo-hydrolase [Anaerolineae bacterium]